MLPATAELRHQALVAQAVARLAPAALLAPAVGTAVEVAERAVEADSVVAVTRVHRLPLQQAEAAVAAQEAVATRTRSRPEGKHRP